MNILFVHQNFPGQYVHIVHALAQQGGHRIVALGLKAKSPDVPKSVHYIQYHLPRGNAPGVHPLAGETEAKVIRAEACAQAAHNLKHKGFVPDIICAHPGWGEALFLVDVWPNSPLLAYQEFFYHPRGLDTDFDPELQVDQNWENFAKIRMKNAYLNLTLHSASWNVTPTAFQRSTFPPESRRKMSVIHDGVNVSNAKPVRNPKPLMLPDGTLLKKEDKIVTFVNRCLEPYRGYHTFIRSIPYLQSIVPDAQIVIVGSTSGVSYGSPAPIGEWKDYFLADIDGHYDESRVHFTGTIPYNDFLPLLQLSNCHVYLTYPFVLSWSLIEAMSCACPIVGSDTAPVQEVICHGKNGILVDFFSPSMLADAIAELLQNPNHARKLGRLSRQIAIERFSLDTCLPRHLNLIDLVSSRSICCE